MNWRACRHRIAAVLWLAILIALPVSAGYKLLHWSPQAIESYPAQQTNDKVTIAAEPLYTNALAARVFDKKDVLSRGIMPLALVIRNDNDFAVELFAESIELVLEGQRLKTLDAMQTLHKLYGRLSLSTTPAPSGRNPPRQVPLSLPKVPKEAIQDFKQKFFGHKTVFPRSTEGGFLFIPIPHRGDLIALLANSKVYVPDVNPVGKGNPIMFFEFDLKPAMSAPRRK
jgi:hypothetical protein